MVSGQRSFTTQYFLYELVLKPSDQWMGRLCAAVGFNRNTSWNMDYTNGSTAMSIVEMMNYDIVRIQFFHVSEL